MKFRTSFVAVALRSVPPTVGVNKLVVLSITNLVMSLETYDEYRVVHLTMNY